MSLKSLILAYLPAPVLEAIRRIHYLRALRRSYEEQEQDLIVVKLLARPGSCVLDVGANIGVYTKVLSQAAGPEGLVISLEPIPDTFNILSYCVKKLGLSNVRAINCALSDKNGMMSMSVPRYEKGGNYNYYQAKLVVEGAKDSTSAKQTSVHEYHNITVRTLDDLLKEISSPVAFIKCDVEGHEFAVLVGSRMVIERWFPAWLIEVSGDPDVEGSSAAKLFDLLCQAGYEAWIFSGGLLRRRVHGDKWLNYFFLKKSHLALVESFIMK